MRTTNRSPDGWGRKRPLRSPIAASVAALIVLAACGTPEDADTAAEPDTNDEMGVDDDAPDGEPTQGGTLRVSVSANPSTLDPMAGNIGSDHQLLYPMFDTLVDMDFEDGEPVPMLASDWDFEDPQTLIMELRDDVTFHDGEPFDAEAVAFNLDRAANHPQTNVAPDVASIESVEVVDDHTVELSLNQPDAGLLLKLADRAGMMVSPAASEEHGENFGVNPVGTGPHQFVEWRDGESLSVERFDDYWQDDLPYLDGIEMIPHEDRQVGINALLAGEVDLMHTMPAAMVAPLEEDNDVTVDISSALYINILYIDMSQEPFDDARVRLALNYAIDREAILEGAYSGVGSVAKTLLPEDHWASPDDLDPEYEHDPERARELLEEAGHGDGFSFEMGSLPDGDQVRRAEIIQADLAEVGLDVSIESSPVAESTQRFFEEQDWPVYSSAWTGRPAPQLSYALMFNPDSYFNAGDVEVEGLAEHLEAADVADDVDDQAAALSEAANVVAEEAPFVPVHDDAEVAAYRGNVQGFEPHSLGKMRLDYVYLNE